MLLVEFPINNTIQRISDQVLELEHSWKPYVVSFTPPNRSMDKVYGGMVRFGGGSITISNQLFRDFNTWPPPTQAIPTIKYTATNEAAEITFFTNLAHLTSYNDTEANYDLREEEFTDQLLLETTDVDGNDAVIPMAIGTVTHVTPLQIENDALSRQTYQLSGLQTGTTPFDIIATELVVGGTKFITDGNHGFSNGDSITIVGFQFLSGRYTISAASGAIFTAPVDFTEEPMPFQAQCYTAGAFSVYEGGIPLDTVVINGDGTFSLSNRADKAITMTGTSLYTTLSELASYIRTKIGVPTYTTTYARSPSPPLNRWVTTQQLSVDLLSAACTYSTHLYSIEADALILVDMFKDNGSRTLTEYQFFKSPTYSKVNPLKKITASWETRQHTVGFVNNDTSGAQSHFVKATPHEIEESLFAYGSEETIDPFHDDEAFVRSALICIRSAYYEKDQASISIPLEATPPNPGEKISWTDGNIPVDIPVYIHACNISYDFIGHEILLTGPGRIIWIDGSELPGDTPISGATTETVDSFDMTLSRGAIWRYVIDGGSGANMRVGIIQGCWDQAAGGSVEMTPDEHSDDIGTTIGVVTFAIEKAATIVRLRAASTGGDFTIYIVRTLIGAFI